MSKLSTRIAQRFAGSKSASGKTWYDIQNDAQTEYISAAAEALAKELKGTSKVGGFASAEVTHPKGRITLGFKGGSSGMIYTLTPKRKEFSVVSHTPQSLAEYLINILKLR